MPSAKVLKTKQAIVTGLVGEFKDAKTMVLADYRGLTVAQDTELRAALRKAGVKYKVVKNSLAQLAAREVGYEIEELFKGPTAIAYSDSDPVGPAKVLKKFADQFEALEIKGGITDGQVADLESLNALASIPDVEVLYAQVVGGLAAPLTGLALMIKAIADKCEAEGAETAAAVYEGPKTQDEPAAEEAVADAE